MTQATNNTPISQVPLSDVRRAGVTLSILVVVTLLFFWMVAKVLLAAVVGIVAAIYLRPLYRRLNTRLKPATSAILTLTGVILPGVAMMAYGYAEIRRAAKYLDANAQDVASRIQQALGSLPFDIEVTRQSVHQTVIAVAEYATKVPEAVQGALGGFSVALAVFLFTAFYVLTDADGIIAYLRKLTPSRYAPLTEALEANARGALHGAVYATMIAQALKALLMLALNLVLGVPLPFTLALITFVIGFFPVVGTWTVYLPAAAYLAVFQGSTTKALIMLVAGFLGSTIFIALYLRPRMASDRSKVLNFYWMFLGLVAGVYTFGIPGIIVGPLIVGLLKALMDTLTTPDVWERPTERRDEGEAKAEILVREELEAAERAKEAEAGAHGGGPEPEASPA